MTSKYYVTYKAFVSKLLYLKNEITKSIKEKSWNDFDYDFLLNEIKLNDENAKEITKKINFEIEKNKYKKELNLLETICKKHLIDKNSSDNELIKLTRLEYHYIFIKNYNF